MKQARKIKPFIRGVFQRPVIQIESVNVDMCANFFLSRKKQGSQKETPHPALETTGVVVE